MSLINSTTAYEHLYNGNIRTTITDYYSDGSSTVKIFEKDTFGNVVQSSIINTPVQQTFGQPIFVGITNGRTPVVFSPTNSYYSQPTTVIHQQLPFGQTPHLLSGGSNTFSSNAHLGKPKFGPNGVITGFY
jgi:hypothetical protein